MKRALLGVCLAGAYAAWALAPISATAAGPTRVTCRGSERLCSASVSLAGGVSNKLVMIGLPGTRWRSPSVSVSPASSRGAYSITSARFTLGGSVYRFILNAVRSNPRSARLTFTFRAPGGSTPNVAKPACTMRALESGLRASRMQGRVDANSWGCAGRFAYAGVTVHNIEITVLFRAQGKSWKTASRQKYCNNHQVPARIYRPACETN
jgi:hypothetical protein